MRHLKHITYIIEKEYLEEKKLLLRCTSNERFTITHQDPKEDKYFPVTIKYPKNCLVDSYITIDNRAKTLFNIVEKE